MSLSSSFLRSMKVRSLIKGQYGSLFAFARVANIDPSLISRYLGGLPIGMKNARRVAKALGTSIDEILGDDDVEMVGT